MSDCVLKTTLDIVSCLPHIDEPNEQQQCTTLVPFSATQMIYRACDITAHEEEEVKEEEEDTRKTRYSPLLSIPITFRGFGSDLPVSGTLVRLTANPNEMHVCGKYSGVVAHFSMDDIDSIDTDRGSDLLIEAFRTVFAPGTRLTSQGRRDTQRLTDGETS